MISYCGLLSPIYVLAPDLWVFLSTPFPDLLAPFQILTISSGHKYLGCFAMCLRSFALSYLTPTHILMCSLFYTILN